MILLLLIYLRISIQCKGSASALDVTLRMEWFMEVKGVFSFLLHVKYQSDGCRILETTFFYNDSNYQFWICSFISVSSLGENLYIL